MSSARFETIVRQMCEALDLPDVESVLNRRVLWVEGFEVYLHLPTPQPEDDVKEEALYLRIAYGLPPAGRTL
ncbi:4-hydroxyphenylacetate 3-monooxygenase, partial [Xanthomonas perforans]|nr:4-hydroxyphenylacetate 3-monooxygenase [Xanthomonas perforans]